MADQKTTTATADEAPARRNKQINATVPTEVFDDLEGYAFGTRRKVSELVRDVVLDWHKSNKAEIDAKKV